MRNKTVAKPIDEFTSGGFEPILTESYQADKVTKVILATGKMFIDLKEALEIAARGKVKAHISVEPLENINDIFDRMEAGKIDGRIVIDMSL